MIHGGGETSLHLGLVLPTSERDVGKGARDFTGRPCATGGAVVLVVMAVSCAIFAVAYAVGGLAATEDNWVGFVGAASLLGGLEASLAAFVMAVVTRVRHERSSLLWLPLTLFPTLLAVVLLAEVFWVE